MNFKVIIQMYLIIRICYYFNLKVLKNSTYNLIRIHYVKVMMILIIIHFNYDYILILIIRMSTFKSVPKKILLRFNYEIMSNID
jgi:hypothetical protein